MTSFGRGAARATPTGPRAGEGLSIAELGESPDFYGILVQHAYRGIRVQFGLRAVLVAFMVAAIAAVPPAVDRTPCYLIVAVYAVWFCAVAVWTGRGGEAPVRWMWVVLVVDAGALSALTLVAGRSAEQTWTADLLVNGFFIIPLLAATQLRPWVCAAVATPAVLAYFGSSVATKTANTEPWGSIIVRTLVLAGLGAGCVALSRVQLSRVLTIGRLVQDRTELLNELLSLEARERTTLAEQLHDGALQYVLAARHDLEDAQDSGDPQAFARVDHALAESSGLLRATVSQLHPAVLQQAGLARAVHDLAAGAAERAHLELSVDVAGWPERPGALDGLLFGCARELLTNVVKHAQAHRIQVGLARIGERAVLTVADDGRGLDEQAPSTRLAEGHIGLASLRTRVAAGGGTLTTRSGPGAGTTVTVELPYPAVDGADQS